MDAPLPPQQHHHGGGRERSTTLTLASASAPPATDQKQSQKKRKQNRPRTLLLLLKSLVGLRIRIDLKNDSIIEGVVQEVVHDMEYVHVLLSASSVWSSMRITHALCIALATHIAACSFFVHLCAAKAHRLTLVLSVQLYHDRCMRDQDQRKE
ncbi:hypothetical protein FI667_g3447, partial [Globisporangium splendens]